MTEMENGRSSPEDGPEEKAAKVLNAVMIMLLAGALAAFASWLLFGFLKSVLESHSLPWEHVFVRFLNPLAVLYAAAIMARFGFRMLKRRSQ